MKYIIFAYGTLRKGEKNHYLIRKAECVSPRAYTHGKLYDTGYGYPAMIAHESEKVYGELYAIDEDMLEMVDRLEGYRKGRAGNLYERTEVSVQADGSAYTAVTYVAGTSLHLTCTIPFGDWKKYREMKEKH